MLAFHIDASDPRPVFRQIVDEVQRSVALGILRPGEALPAVRLLAAQLKINANTVQHAYRELEREGTVYVKRGIGTFVAAALREVKNRQGQWPGRSRKKCCGRPTGRECWRAI